MASRFFKHLYFLRFSIAGWLFLPILCALDGTDKTASITRAILTLDSGWQVFYATFFVVALGMTVLITARNTVRNGVLRFCDAKEFETDGLYTLLTDASEATLWKTLGIAHIPTLLTLGYLAYISQHEQETFCGYWAYFFVFMFAGLAAALVFWYVVSLFYYWTYRPSHPAATPSALLFPHRFFGTIGAVSPPPRLTTIIDWITGKFLARFSSDGYSAAPGQPVWELHFLSAVSLVGILIVYAFLFPLTAPVLNGVNAFVAEIVACLAVTGGFIYSIANAGFHSPPPPVFCTWAPWVKRGFIGLALVVAATFLIAVVFDHHNKSVRLEMAFPTFGSVLVLSVFFLWLFAGAAFFLDRYRIPVFTAVLLIIFLPKLAAPYAADCLVKNNCPWLAEIFDSDHFFTVKQLPDGLKTEQVLDPARVLAARVKNPDEPYLIVTASGGGIRAAEWTAQVMAQLEQTFAADGALKSKQYNFHDHLLLASGVSGGSVGLMSYLLEYTGHPKDHDGLADKAFPAPATDDLRKALADRIARPPACSSLEAVGWGLSYRDLLGLFAPLRFPPISRREGLTLPEDTWAQAALASDTQSDRSWALAEAFNRNLNDEHCGTLPGHGKPNPFDGLPIIDDGNALTLYGAARMLHDGRMPAFTFNTTAEETGSRFLLSNYTVTEPPIPTDGRDSNFIPAESFLQVYAMDRGDHDSSFRGRGPLYADLPLSTAARLSATFPIVSSGTRIPPAYVPHAYHFLDGGYFDNDGTASAIEFLKSALDDAETASKDPKAVQPIVGIPTKKLKIVLIEIRDDDGTGVIDNKDDLASQNQSSTSNWTPLTQLTGLVGGLWNAGHSSISRRNRRELCIEESRYSDRLEVRHIVFTIPNDPDKLSPLSWKLTSRRNDLIDKRAKRDDMTHTALTTTVGNVRNLMGEDPPKTDAPVFPKACEAWTEPIKDPAPLK